ncbi:MAG: hypothetical protein O7A63_09185 [Acidobacteria bacterium]|nr:hypothetical protein [Acidobacteriota bacterium]
MRRCLAALFLLLVLPLTIAVSKNPIGEEQAKTAALEFGRALVKGDVSSLRAVLPTRGKIRLRLLKLGPEEGAYGAGQVQAVLKDFLRHGEVRTFDLLRLDCASEQFALVHARSKISDRDGRTAEIDLHLSFQVEEGRWVLQEIRETPR